MINSIKLSTRKPAFWIVMTILSLSGIAFAYKFFPYAFPILDLQLTMDRQQALNKAKDLAQKYQWGPESYQQAASFKADSHANNFIELEGGGPSRLREIIKQEYYSPYFWIVRHFKEYDPVETKIIFTPAGKPYGFVQKIPDFMPGAALTTDEARVIAVTTARNDWGIDFNLYKNVEESEKIASSGRIEHTFVYERKDEKVGEAPYRLRLVVNGDQLTELKLALKVPEAFTRRYQEMRSSNNTIALTATIIMILLYIFGGCLFGLFFFLKDNWLLWKKALVWGLIISTLQAANALNELPLTWLHYDTALSLTQFLSKILVGILIQFFIFTALCTVLFMVAEGLTRKAFPNHIQFWKLWSPNVASSLQLLGRTVGSYLILGFDFAFSIGFYYFAINYFGWWSPSEALYNPDSIATYVPWLTVISSSLSAGFMEEMLFRAIPLSCAALLGNRYGKRTWWITAAFILQAVVFGAAHANYAAQPAFARLVELIIPSFVFGFLYLVYGLLPAIISHFIFDVVWFSLPIFVSHAPGIWADKVMIIIMSLIPLLVILYARLRFGSWHELSTLFYNKAWQPTQRSMTDYHQEPYGYSAKSTFKFKHFALLFMLAGIGSVSWYFNTDFKYDSGLLPLNRAGVIDFIKKSYSLDSWNLLSAVENPLQSKYKNQHIFIWKQLGQQSYHDLLNKYLMAPSWKVRLVHFNGDIINRAQEYQLYVTTDALNQPYFIRSHHKLPESFAALSLTYEQAREKALEVIARNYNLSKEQLKEISGVQRQQPERVDWVFTFQDTTQSLGEGQARITVEIGGDQVVDHYPSIFVPEQWERDYKSEESFLNLVNIVRICFLFLFFILGGFLLVRKNWHYLHVNKMFFALVSCMLLIKYAIQVINTWPLVSIHFSTAEPYNFQAWTVLGIVLVLTVFKTAIYGLLAGIFNDLRLKSSQLTNSFFMQALLGIVSGVIVMGSYETLLKLIKIPIPQWPDFLSLSAYSPVLSILLSSISSYIETTLLVLFAVTFFDYLSQGWKKNRIITALIIIFFTACTFDITALGSLTAALTIGIGSGIGALLLYAFIIRFSKPSIPLLTATVLSITSLKNLIAALYPGIIPGTLLAIVFMMVFGSYWAYQLYNHTD